MAKKQLNLPATPNLSGWNDVNSALKRMGELTIGIRELENKKTELISEITSKFDSDAAPLITEIKSLENSILQYCDSHKDEFIKERTKELSHGSISMRVSTSVKIISKAICLKVLKSMGMHDYIKVKEEPNKDMLKTLPDIDLAKLSCERKTVDNITIVPKIEEIIVEPIQKDSAPSPVKKNSLSSPSNQQEVK